MLINLKIKSHKTFTKRNSIADFSVFLHFNRRLSPAWNLSAMSDAMLSPISFIWFLIGSSRCPASVNPNNRSLASVSGQPGSGLTPRHSSPRRLVMLHWGSTNEWDNMSIMNSAWSHEPSYDIMICTLGGPRLVPFTGRLPRLLALAGGECRGRGRSWLWWGRSWSEAGWRARGGGGSSGTRGPTQRPAACGQGSIFWIRIEWLWIETIPFP